MKRAELTRTAVIRSHREQWRTLVDRVEMVRDELAAGETDVIKAMKVYAETLKIIHDGERRAWGIDEASLRPANRATLELRCGSDLVELSAPRNENMCNDENMCSEGDRCNEGDRCSEGEMCNEGEVQSEKAPDGDTA